MINMEKLIMLPVLLMVMVVLVSGCIFFPAAEETGDGQEQPEAGEQAPPGGELIPSVNETPSGEPQDVGYW